MLIQMKKSNDTIIRNTEMKMSRNIKIQHYSDNNDSSSKYTKCYNNTYNHAKVCQYKIPRHQGKKKD